MKNNRVKILKRIMLCMLTFVILVPCMFLMSACSFNGKSAYEIAVDNGFVGTEKEWLASLKGADGIDGQNGEDAKIDSFQLYEAAKDRGEIAADCTYLQFIKQYWTDLNIKTDTTARVANEAALSVCEVYPVMSTFSVSGSGFVYSIGDSGVYIITNYHVAYCESQYNSASVDKIYTESGDYVYKYFHLNFYGSTTNEVFEAEYFGGSSLYDIAVLKLFDADAVNFKSTQYKAVTMRETEAVLGENVVAMGNPAGEGLAVNKGVISKISDVAYLPTTNTTLYHRVIVHDAFITHGSSGGGLFDENGKLLGITNGGDDRFDSFNFAIPSTIAKSVADSIISECSVKTGTKKYTISKPFLGAVIDVDSTSVVYHAGTGQTEIVQSIKVTDVGSITLNGTNYNGVLYDAGLLEGDIIKSVKLNNTKYDVTASYFLPELMLKAKVGDKVTLNVKRSGEANEIPIEVTLNSSNFKCVDCGAFSTGGVQGNSILAEMF